MSAGTNVHLAVDNEDMRAVVAEYPALIVVFVAPGCVACEQFLPRFWGPSGGNPGVHFCVISVLDSAPHLLQEHAVSVVPTFVAYAAGAVQSVGVGACVNALQWCIDSLRITP